MKKVAIITLNGYYNYGNRLQNYALQETLKSLNCEVETVLNRKRQINGDKKHSIRSIKEISLFKIPKSLFRRLENILYRGKLDKKRTKVFREFTDLYIKETRYTISEDNLPNDLSGRYDYFVVGSDQIWNPKFRRGSSIDFLTFAPVNKRIAYAPSFGISEIPDEYKDRYKKWLSEIKYISVREEAGAKIIKDLANREAPVLLDPTLLLTKEKWLSISSTPFKKPEKYLLTYFLGEIPKERRRFINTVAKEKGLKVINLAKISDRQAYLTGPSEFIDYINSASALFTDSFHGCVFSILFETPFVIFDRNDNSPSMNSRIDTLLTKFKLESRMRENIKEINDIFNINYSHVKPILEKEREKSFNFLKESLNIKSE